MAWFRWTKDAPAPADAVHPLVLPPGDGGPREVTHKDFTREHEAALNLLYWDLGQPLDGLPYTDDFDALHGQFLLKTGLNASRHSVWRALVACRKAGRLKRPDDGEG